MRTCSRCHETKPLSEFYPKARAKGGLTPRCKDCLKAINLSHYHDTLKHDPEHKVKKKEISRKWHLANGDYARDRQRRARLELRRKCLEAYGSICQCCGESRYEFLAIDHINGGGGKHRREVGGGDKVYRWMAKNNFPAGFRVLCHNCNMAIAFYGECPHQRARRIAV